MKSLKESIINENATEDKIIERIANDLMNLICKNPEKYKWDDTNDERELFPEKKIINKAENTLNKIWHIIDNYDHSHNTNFIWVLEQANENYNNWE